MKDGIYFDMPEDEYHASDAISCSGLKEILRKSPRHYAYKYREGGQKETKALNFGKAAHMALLEPERFDVTYVVEPQASRATIDGCKTLLGFWEKFNTDGGFYGFPDKPKINDFKAYIDYIKSRFDGEVVSYKDMEIINGIADAIKAKPVTHKILSMEGKREVTLFWDEQGIQCRARLDLLATKGLIADFKTTTNASPEGFQRQAYNYDYHMQAYWYQRGWQRLTGETLPFLFIPAEKEPPHCVAAYQADKDMLDLGAIDCVKALGIYEQCLEQGTFHDYPDTITPLGLPKWAENRLTYGD